MIADEMSGLADEHAAAVEALIITKAAGDLAVRVSVCQWSRTRPVVRVSG